VIVAGCLAGRRPLPWVVADIARVISEATVRIHADSSDAERDAERAGSRYGKAFADSADREGGRSDLAAILARQVEQSSERVARARDKEVDAATKVRLAEEALDRLRTSGNARASQLAAAEERLAAAKLRLLAAQDSTDDSTNRLAQAQSALQGQLARTEQSAGRLSNALSRLRRDTDGIDFSRLAAGALKASAALTALSLAGAALHAGLGGLVIGVAGVATGLGQLGGLAAGLPALLGGIGLAFGAVKIGLTNFKAALSVMGDAKAFEEVLKDLAPAAQETARAIAGMKPAFDALRLDVQQRLFEGLAGPIQKVGNAYLPILRQELALTASAFNTVVKDIINMQTAPKVVSDLALAWQRVRSGTQSALGALQPLVQAFSDLFVVGAEFAPRFGQAIQDLAQRFANFIREARETGKIREWISNGITAAKQFGQILGNLGGAIGGVFRAANTAVGGALASLVELTAELKRVVNSVEGQTALISFFSGVRDAVNALKPVVSGLLNIMGALGPVITGVAQAVGPVLGPFLDQLAVAIEKMTPGIIAFASGFSSVVKAITPLLPTLGEIIGAIGTSLGGALEFASPLLSKLVDAFKFLSPVLTPLIGTFGALAVGVGSFTFIMKTLSPAITAVRVAWSLLSAVFSLSPLGRLIFLLGLLATGLIVAYQKSETFRDIVHSIVGVLDIVGEAISGFIDGAIQFFGTTLPEGVKAGIDAIVNFFTVTLLEGVRAAINAVVRVVSSIIGSITDTWNRVKDVTVSEWNELRNAVTGAVNAVRDAVTTAINSVVNFLSNAWNNARNAAVTAWNNIQSTISNGANNILNVFRNLPGNILNALGNLANTFVRVGADIISGIGRGIQNGWNWLIQQVQNLAQSLFNAAKSALGIGSPSRLFRDEIGKQLSEGAAIGVEARSKAVTDAVRRMAEAATTAARIDLSTLIGQVSAPTLSRVQSAIAAAREATNARGVNVGSVLDEAERIVNNIVINNPQAEKSSDSVNRELRRFAAMGGFAR
jgi:phage-related protein